MPAKHVTANECIQGHDSSGVPQPFTNRDGALPAYGLARNLVMLGASSIYNTREILGFICIAAGSDTWSITPVGGSAVTGITQTAFTAGQVYPIHATSITTPAGGVALLFIPDA